MNKIKLIITALALTICATSFAQEMSAKEKKKLMKGLMSKLKGMDAQEADKMFTEYPNLSTEVESLNTKVSSLESDVSTKDGEISTLQSDLEAANAKVNEMNAMSTASSDSSGEAGSDGGSNMNGSSTMSRATGEVIPGLIYKVQIGAFRNKDLTKYFNNSKNFGGEVDGDGTKKYSIGQFTEYWEADSFKKYMREMGVKDAWIVPYFNGKRVSMKDAREGVLN